MGTTTGKKARKKGGGTKANLKQQRRHQKNKRKKSKAKSKDKEQKIFMPKSEKNKKTGRVEAYTFGEAIRKPKWPH